MLQKSDKELLLSELLLAIMEEDEPSIKRLAKEVGISPSVIQATHSEDKMDMSIKNFIKVLQGLGFTKMTVGRGGRHTIPLDISHLYTK